MTRKKSLILLSMMALAIPCMAPASSLEVELLLTPLLFTQPINPVIPYTSVFMRTVLDDATAAAARTTLGVALGVNVQAYDPNLTLFSALTVAAGYIPYWTSTTAMGTIASTAQGRALLDDADAATQRTTLGLGTIATQNANAVAITGGTIQGITDMNVADGGTGASTFTDGGVLLGSGTGAITAMGVLSDGQFIVGDGTTDPVAESGETALASLGIDANWIPMVNNTESDAERRTWKSNTHLDHVYDVRDYGATTASSDNTAAFVAATAALPDGGTLFLPVGNWVCRSQITIHGKRNFRIVGSGGPMISGNANANSSNWVYGGTASDSNAVLCVENCRGWSVENVVFDGDRRAGYGLRTRSSVTTSGPCGEYRIVNCGFQGSTENFFADSGGVGGTNQNDLVMFDHCIFTDAKNYGVHVNAASATNFSFSNCIWYSSSQIGPQRYPRNHAFFEGCGGHMRFRNVNFLGFADPNHVTGGAGRGYDIYTNAGGVAVDGAVSESWACLYASSTSQGMGCTIKRWSQKGTDPNDSPNTGNVITYGIDKPLILENVHMYNGIIDVSGGCPAIFAAGVSLTSYGEAWSLGSSYSDSARARLVNSPGYADDGGSSLERFTQNGYSRTFYSDAAPTSASVAYTTFDRVINIDPNIGEPSAWVCTASGSPGTWAMEGQVRQVDGDWFGTQNVVGDVNTTGSGTFNAGLIAKNGATNGGFLDLFEDSDGGTSKIRLIAPALVGDVTLILPVDDGTPGQLLQTDGSTVLSWVTPNAAHNAVTLTAYADKLLNLSTQEIDVDDVTANYIWAGPAAGGADEPNYRALVAADIPALSYDATGTGHTEATAHVLAHNVAFDHNDIATALQGVTADAPLSGSGTSGSHLVIDGTELDANDTVWSSAMNGDVHAASRNSIWDAFQVDFPFGADVNAVSEKLTGTLEVPSIHGGIAANDDITIQGTTDSTRTTSYVNLQPNGGNVGIGTTAPGELLDIGGYGTGLLGSPVVGIKGNYNGISGVEMYNSNAGSATEFRFSVFDQPRQNYLSFTIPDNTSGGAIFGLTRNTAMYLFTQNTGAGTPRNLALGTITNNSLIFGTNNAERVRIDSAGNVGIGDLTPTYALDVAGTFQATGNAIIGGTLTVNGNQTGALDMVFDDYNDLQLLRDWREGKALPFKTGDMLNRDRLLRDTILQLDARVKQLEVGPQAAVQSNQRFTIACSLTAFLLGVGWTEYRRRKAA